MTNWTGFDKGGVEFLWEEPVLMRTLEVFRSVQPFSRSDPDDPVFAELETQLPDYVWFNTDAQGSKRPIFRRSNLWDKLGLTHEDDQGVSVTSAAEEVLAGQLSLRQVFADAAYMYEENGEFPYRRLAAAVLEEPDHLFSLEEIEFGIAEHFKPGVTSVEDALRMASDSGLSASRARRLRGFLKPLEHSQAIGSFMSDGSRKWGLRDVSALSHIAGVNRGGLSARTSLEQNSAEMLPSGSSSIGRKRRLGVATSSTGPRNLKATPNGAMPSDPRDRILALEKANASHARVMQLIAAEAAAVGADAWEDPASYDAAVFGPPEVLIEAKSISPANAQSQIRKAIAQLFEYRWTASMSSQTRLIIALSADPRPWLPIGYLDFLESDLNLTTYWPSGSSLVNSSGNRLHDALV